MKLVPGDLSPELAAEIIARRAAASVGSQARGRRAMMNQTGPAFGPFQNSLRASTGLSEPAATETLDRVGRHFSFLGTFLSGVWGVSLAIPALAAGIAGQAYTPATVFAILAMGGVALGQAIPRWSLKRLCTTPILEGEIDSLLADATDPLERAYFQLLRDAQAQKNLTESAEKELRSALRALGDAMEQLPPAAPESAIVAPETLLAEAKALREKGIQEADQTVSDSLLRQADARARSAEAIAHSHQLLRRNAVLRDELIAQTEALRIGLAVQTTEHSDTGEFANLAESARRIAAEATSLTDARTELDSVPQKVRLG